MAVLDRRIGWLFVGFLALLTVAVLRAVDLGVLRAGSLQQAAVSQQITQNTIPAPRGLITDRKGVELAISESADDVIADDFLIKNPLATAQKLAPLLGKPVLTVLGLLSKRNGYVHLARLIPADTATRIMKLQINGISLVPKTTRTYPRDWAASQVLGSVHLSGQGASGLEYYYDSTLSGTDGVRRIVNDAIGQPISIDDVRTTRPGKTLSLTIDAALQGEVEQVLAGVGAQYSPKGATAIVMNPQTGEVYSMVSLPDYNLNQFADGITTAQYQALLDNPQLPLLNRAIGGVYPPGSTFKPVTASAGLQAGTINQGSSINCPGHFTVGTSSFLCWNTAGHGAQNVVAAIAHSCDVFFYTVADRMGDQILSQYASDFGVGRATGIDLTGEAKGIVPNSDWKTRYFAEAYQETGDPAWQDSKWYEGNTITYGIGQSYLLVTPLQDLEWIATVANGGRYLRPLLTNRVSSVAGAMVKPFSPVVDHTVKASPQVLALVREGLRAAAAPGGTSGFIWSQAQFKGVPSPAGKTGTAQFGVADHSGNYPLHAWYAAYAPSVDPEIAVVTFVEGGGEGHEASAPVAAQIMSYYFAHRDAIRATSDTPSVALGPGTGG